MAFAHGRDDAALAERLGTPVTECLVDESGCYTKEMGPELSGQSVLESGQMKV